MLSTFQNQPSLCLPLNLLPFPQHGMVFAIDPFLQQVIVVQAAQVTGLARRICDGSRSPFLIHPIKFTID